MPKKVFLWTAPRCISTAFERCIMEIKNSKIFHEPYSKPYHFGPERQSPRYLFEKVDVNSTYQNVLSILTKEYDGLDLVFSKDMAYAIENNFESLLHKDLSEFQHTFLVRNPRKTVPSLYKASVNTQLTGWDYFDPDEAGFKQLKELYEFVQQHFHDNPVVVDADDLQLDPEGTISAYCKAIDVRFDEKILHWEPGPISDWDVWNGWHDDALKSCGFTKQTLQKNFEDLSVYPKEVQQCVNDSLPIYQILVKSKLLPSTRIC